MKIDERINNLLSEMDNKESIEINEAIFDMSGTLDAGGIGKKKITLPIVATDEKAAEKKFKESVVLHIKNGHLPKGTLSNIKIGK